MLCRACTTFWRCFSQNERHIGSNSLLYITKPSNREKLDGAHRNWIYSLGRLGESILLAFSRIYFRWNERLLKVFIDYTFITSRSTSIFHTSQVHDIWKISDFFYDFLCSSQCHLLLFSQHTYRYDMICM